MKLGLFASTLMFFMGLAFLTPNAKAQTNASITYVTVVPSGSCQARSNLRLYVPSGALYSCQSGSWAQISGGGGGSCPAGSANIVQKTNGTACVASTITDNGTTVSTTLPIKSGSGSGVAGTIDLAQGTLPALATTAISLIAPMAVTSYAIVFAGAAPAGNQLMVFGTPSSGYTTQIWSTLLLNGGIWYPTTNSTTAEQWNKADGTTNIMTLDTTNGQLAINGNIEAGSNPAFLITDSTAAQPVWMRITQASLASSFELGVAGVAGQFLTGVSAGDAIFKAFGTGVTGIAFGTASNNGAVLMRLAATGHVAIGINNLSTTGTVLIADGTATTGITRAIIQEGAGQSTNEVFSVYASNLTTKRIDLTNNIFSITSTLNIVGSSFTFNSHTCTIVSTVVTCP